MKARNGYLYAGIVAVAVIIAGAFFLIYRSSQTDIAGVLYAAPPEIESIHSFMGDPNMGLIKTGTRAPSNFTVGRTESIGNGDERTTVPVEWKRQVDTFEQKSLTKDCKLYTYEVDTKSGKVVQVQLASNPPVGSDMEIEQAQCERANPLRQVTDTEAEDLAWAYARKNVPNLTQTKAKVSLDKGDRYVWTWEDTSYNLPEGLTSEPWQYPIIRVILDKQGRLMTYLNTTFFYGNQY